MRTGTRSLARDYEIQVIINADDFGRSPAVNAAVKRAHREGILTSASLMVTGDAAQEAIAIAREMPSLAVGLHVVVASGRAALPPKEIPHIVKPDGRFPDDPVRQGLLYAFSRTARRELARELSAQFERFAATGLALSHVDGHQHLHMHPVVFNLLIPLAEQYGAKGLRLPRDDLWLALGYDRRQAGAKILWAIALNTLCRWGRGRLSRRRLVVTHRVYGAMQTGHMTEDYVARVLQRIEVPTAELYFHPTLGTEVEALGPNPNDLATLLSPTIRSIIRERHLRLTTYARLADSPTSHTIPAQ
ncbi:MAG: hopanoid biosynthesis-associated protein HpnK [Anaerolineae bacterium]|nr:hopanoid biosynthesis-associated protein HpnK [Anaerolineae bacterium]